VHEISCVVTLRTVIFYLVNRESIVCLY